MSLTASYIKHINIELLVWPLAMGALYFMDPVHSGPSLCPLKWMGFSWCPGCGLGHAIHHLLHGEWTTSWRSHPLGIFALGMLSYRTFDLGKQQMQIFYQLKKNPI